MKKLKELPHPDNQHLEAAEGWLELGNWKEANEELELITPQLRAHPFVLEMRYKIYVAAKKWEMAVEIARGMSDLLPDNPWGPSQRFRFHNVPVRQAAEPTVKEILDEQIARKLA